MASNCLDGAKFFQLDVPRSFAMSLVMFYRLYKYMCFQTQDRRIDQVFLVVSLIL